MPAPLPEERSRSAAVGQAAPLGVGKQARRQERGSRGVKKEPLIAPVVDFMEASGVGVVGKNRRAIGWWVGVGIRRSSVELGGFREDVLDDAGDG